MTRPLICVWLPFNGKDSDLISIDGVILSRFCNKIVLWFKCPVFECKTVQSVVALAFSLLLLLITFAISFDPDQEPAQE